MKEKKYIEKGMNQIQYNRSESKLSDHIALQEMFKADIKVAAANCN
jgi:hypothetical protein